MSSLIKRLVSIAPMMEHTDKHFRYLIRCISKHSLLFTEMITSAAIINGDHKKLLSFNVVEHPIAVQIGGRDIEEILSASLIAESYGYDEINLNIGCPSSSVQNGGFGACLMLDKKHVGDIVHTLSNNVKIPISIKCRIGVDDLDTYSFLYDFIKEVSSSRCNIFYVHARKALLSGVSPRDNRRIPKLDYDRVYKLKQDFPHLEIILNGGVNSLENYSDIINHVDGVMIGRTAYKNPYILSDVDSHIYNSPGLVDSIKGIACQYLDYVSQQRITKLFHLTKHMQGLWYGRQNAAVFRRLVTEPSCTVKQIQEFIAKAN